MKMTDADERALAVLGEAHLVISDHKYPDTRKRLREAREYLTARLAADQQKGGGEVVYQVKLNGPIDAWVDTTESQFALAEDHEKRRRKLYTAPQPSIPAPAQQERELEARLSEDRDLLNAIRDAMGGGAYDTLPKRIAALAQQDGKASGGEYLFTSEEVDEAIELLRFHRSSIVTEAIDHMEACLRENVDDALAHPPHAEQETQ